MLSSAKPRHLDRGYTFAEVLVAVAVLAIVSVALAALFSSAHAAMLRAGRRTAALNLCRDKMEAIKAAGYSSYLESIAASPEGVYVEVEETAGGSDLYRRETTLWLTEVPLPGEPDSAPLISIIVEVTWSEFENVRTAQLESCLALR